jgi:hypothetical protein
MTYATTVTTVGALTANQKLLAVASRTGFVRVYDPTLGGTVSAASANLPNVATVTLKQALDDAAPWYGAGHTGGSNGPYTGEVQVALTVPAVDVVNAPSVQNFATDGNAIAVVATG